MTTKFTFYKQNSTTMNNTKYKLAWIRAFSSTASEIPLLVVQSEQRQAERKKHTRADLKIIVTFAVMF